MIASDYKETAKLCEKRLLEGGYAYLIDCNERWTDLHIKILVHFHHRICFCMKDLMRILFDEMRSGMRTSEEAEAYIRFVQGKCFSLFSPVVSIIQEILSEDETTQLYDTFEWMEHLDRMHAFLNEEGNYDDANNRLMTLLAENLQNDRTIRAYELMGQYQQ